VEITYMAIGPSGWVRFGAEEEGSPELFLRFRRGEDGRWRIHEVYLDAGRPISAQSLRLIPYAQCEEWVNQHGEKLAERWDDRDPVGDNLAVLASYLGQSFPWNWNRSDRHRTNWVATAYLSRLPKEEREARGVGYLMVPGRRKRKSSEPQPRLLVETDADRNYRLTAGSDTFPISDEFLLKVARAYRAAIERGQRNPNVTIGQDAHVAPRTAARWVAKARERGFLGPARKGAAG
jgi:hypothetical protein